MKTRFDHRGLIGLIAAALCTAAGAQGIEGGNNMATRASIDVHIPRVMQNVGSVATVVSRFQAKDSAAVTSSATALPSVATKNYPSGTLVVSESLPLWTFDIKGSRDGDHHQGTMVGGDPFRNPGTSKVATYILPLVFRTHTIATHFDPNANGGFGGLSTKPGETTIDPTRADATCMAAPNDTPSKVFEQSPIFNAPPKPFVFGGQTIGATQYVDAFQRSNFWRLSNIKNYHVLLDPVVTLPAIVIDVPATAGIALTNPELFGGGFLFCAPMLLVDVNWLDSYLNGTVLEKLQEEGVNPGNLPLYLSYNTAFPIGDVTNLGNCCAIGYHGTTGTPLPLQTYAVVDFDTTEFFLPAKNGVPPGLNTEVAAHEVGEWMNDPLISNETAPWGGTGQVAGCQANLEVGDPLSGTDVVPVTMPNGFTYNLQELAFFSWFFGAPS
ncbi:MAG: hypothetical protein JOZ12_06845, partial [Sinobacteraceae bacterium]|nr:hypothetical protein [Nevskiaceae bacterium]